MKQIAFIEKERKAIEQAQPYDRIGISIPNIRCKDIPRGTVLSEEANTPARNLRYAVGFFLTVNYKGELKSGMKLYLVNNRIQRKCIIELDSQVEMNSKVLIDKIPVATIKSKNIGFFKILPCDPLVLDDPYDFPEFSMAQLWDNCQTVALGKIFKLFYEDNNESFGKEVQKSPDRTKKSPFVLPMDSSKTSKSNLPENILH